jgi:hypothetical protein
MNEWTDIKQRLSAAKNDMKVLNEHEKRLREFIREYMLQQNIDTCNTKDAKVSVKTRTVKSGFTRDLVRKGLLKYFNGDEDRVNYVFDVIMECCETRESSSISFKSIK